MIVRATTKRERADLQPWRHALAGPRRVLDAAEHREVVHLLRSHQATAAELALRFGVSQRTIWRYVNRYPGTTGHDLATARLAIEARRMGLRLSAEACQRLALAAVAGRDA